MLSNLVDVTEEAVENLSLRLLVFFAEFFGILKLVVVPVLQDPRKVDSDRAVRTLFRVKHCGATVWHGAICNAGVDLRTDQSLRDVIQYAVFFRGQHPLQERTSRVRHIDSATCGLNNLLRFRGNGNRYLLQSGFTRFKIGDFFLKLRGIPYFGFLFNLFDGLYIDIFCISCVCPYTSKFRTLFFKLKINQRGFGRSFFSDRLTASTFTLGFGGVQFSAAFRRLSHVFLNFSRNVRQVLTNVAS